MKTGNSKTNKSHILRLNLVGKLDLKSLNKNIALAKLSIYYTWENIKSACNNNRFKIPAPIWNDEFDLPYGLYSTSDVQDYFENVIKKHETIADNSPL